MQENNSPQNSSNATTPPQAAVPIQPTPPPTIIVSNTPPTHTTTKELEAKKNPIPYYLLSLCMLLIGIGLGLFFVKEFPQFNTPVKVASKPTSTNTTPELAVPKDAVQIETCEDNKGSLFVKPQDIPAGPIYMSYKGKVIGIEFMLNTNDIMKNGKYDFLTAENAKIDHIKFGYLSEGHEGDPTPHFHADLYTVPKSTEEAIKCPPGQSQEMNMPGMSINGSSASAMLTPIPSMQTAPKPSTVMQQMQMNQSTLLPTKGY